MAPIFYHHDHSLLSAIPHCPLCLPFPIIYHHHVFWYTPIVSHFPLSAVPHCMSFTIVYYLPLSVNPYVCHSLLSVIPIVYHFPSVSIVCHFPPVCHFLFICHSPLSVIHHCLSFTIVCHSSLSIILQHCLSSPIVCYSTYLHKLRTMDLSQHT